MLHFITRVSRHFILITFISFAIAISAIRIALFCLDFYKAELEVKFTELLHAPVRIGKIHAHLARGLKPELILHEINLSSSATASKPSIELQEIRLRVDLWAMLKQQQIIPASWITLVGAKLTLVYEPDGSLTVQGLQGGNQQPRWLLQGQHYELLQSEITWLDKKNHQPGKTFKHVDISIKNNLQKQRHQLNLLSHLPPAYGDNLRFSSDFNGDLFTPDAVNGRFYVSGKNLHFAKLIPQQSPLKLKINSGSGDFQFWGSVQNSQLSALSGDFHSQNISLQRSDAKKLQLKSLKTQFDWRDQADNWSLAVDDLSLALAQKTYSAARFFVGSDDKAAQHLTANIKSLDLEMVQLLAAFFTQDLKSFKNLSDLSVKGQLRNTLILANLKQKTVNVKGEFQHLSVAAPAPYPQLENLSGTINGTEHQGVLTLNSKNTRFISEPMFRTPLAITTLAGSVHWRQTAKNWQLFSPQLQLDTPYAQSSNHFKINIPKNGRSPFVDLQTAFFNLDANNVKVYFPITEMNPQLLHYLDAAFLQGQIKRGDFLLYGHLSDFPFKKHEGVFQVLFDASDVTMNYAAGWPFFEHLNAKILFENESLAVNIQQAQAERVSILGAKISIPSFSDSQYVLVEDGKISTEINDGLNFLRHTPIKLPLQAVSEQLAIKGNTAIALALQVPLSDKVSEKVIGSASVSGAQLNVLALDLPIRNLSGVFRFTEKGFYSDPLTAFGLGYPLQTQVSLQPDSTVIAVTGTTSVADLEQQFHFSAQNLAQGASDYSAQLILPVAKKISPEINIYSDLSGVSLALPDQLAKKINDSKALDLQFLLTDTPLLPITVRYDKQLNADLLLKKADKTIAGGIVSFAEVKNQSHIESAKIGEFKVNIQQPRFSAPAWLAMIEKSQVSGDKAQLLTDLEILSPELDWAGQALGNFALKLHKNNDLWAGTLDCAVAKGNVQIPLNGDADHKIKLDMERIDLSSLTRLSFPRTSAAQVSKPQLFEINSEQLLLRNHSLGRLEINTERAENGIKIKQFDVIGKDQKLSLTGDWYTVNHQAITRLTGKATAENVGGLLKKFKFNDDLEETSAEIALSLHWQGAPYQFAWRGLSGTADVYFADGRISSIEPGFGRLLGVLAMEQWLKRVRLDFGDIYKEGLTFNDISGHFVLTNGIATTEDLTVDAVPAMINLSGELNLAEQTIDQQISVIPKSLDAVPIAGTIVDRIATLVTQVLTGEQEAGFYLRSKYRIKGKWDKLNVLPLHEQDGILTKTWRGLTDFSWIIQQEQD